MKLQNEKSREDIQEQLSSHTNLNKILNLLKEKREIIVQGLSMLLSSKMLLASKRNWGGIKNERKKSNTTRIEKNYKEFGQ